MPADSPAIAHDVFISYARRDGSDHAAHLQRDLEALGLRVWRDTRDLDPNQDFTAEIENAIEASAYVVVCITPDVKRDNSFVRREIGYALACDRPICVARMEKIVPPVHIVNHTYADFFDGWDRAFALLKNWIERHDKSRPAATTPDPYWDYLKQLLLDLNETITQSVISKETITLRAVESVGDVQRKTRRLNPKFITHVIRDAPEPDPIPQHFDSLHAAYAHARCDNRVLLLGEPGAGKTTTLLAFARDAAAARLSDPAQPLPVFARISGWDSLSQTPLYNWLAAQNDGLTDPTLHSMIETGSALLLLDGLDELGSSRPIDPEHPEKGNYDPRERFLNALPPTGQLILSSRVEEYRAISQQAALNCAVRLEPLDDPQMQAYLADVPDLWEVIAADASLKDALRTPLLLALVRVGFEDAPAAVRALRDLNAGDLNDRIWNAFIDKRWAHEQARQPAIRLPYTPAQLKGRLGRAVVQAMINLRDDTTRILAQDIGAADADSVIALAQRLDLLRPAGAEPVGILFEYGKPAPRQRFLHLRLRDALAFPSVLAALRDPKWVIRRRAAIALGTLGDARAVEPLIAALRDPEQWVRSDAAEALGSLADPRAVEPLIAALRDPDGDVRRSAAGALGSLGDPRAIEPLLAALRNPNAAVRSDAAGALMKLGKLAVEPLIATLRDPDEDVRSRAARALGKLGDARAVEPLIAALRDQEPSVRRSAVEALGRLRDARAVEPLIAALRDQEPSVRRSAVEALGSLADPRAVEPLIAALRDPDGDVRRSAAGALGSLGDARAVEPLLAALHDPAVDVRLRAANALVKLGKPAVEPLIAALQDPNWDVRSNAAWALGRLADPRAVEPLIAALRDPDGDVRRSAAGALGSLGDLRAIEPLLAALRNPNAAVRSRAALALGELGDARAVEALIAALRDPDGDVHRSAAGALMKLGKLAVEPLIATLRDPDEDVRSRAARALGKLGDARAVEPLIAALHAVDRWVRRSAADALGELGDARAVEPLIAALRDQEPSVRRSAVEALEKFKDHPAARKALADYHAGILPPRRK